MSTSFSRAWYEPSAERYTAIRLYDDEAWAYSGQRGITVRTAAAGRPDDLERNTVEFIRFTSLAESVSAMEARRATLEPDAYEVVANEFLSGELPRSPARKSADHVFLDSMDLELRQRHTLAEDELARLRAIGSPWALLLELRADELAGTLPEDRGEARLATWCAPNALRANDTYAHLLSPLELQAQIEFHVGLRMQRRGELVEAERHLARAHAWLPCTRTCAAHANALHRIPGRELQAFALASRYASFGLMEAIVADPRFAEFEASRPKKGTRWATFPKPCTAEDLDTAERQLGTRLDPRYRALATTIGAGTLYRQSPKADHFLEFEHASSLRDARDAFRAWFAGHEETALTFSKQRVALANLLPIAAPSSTAGYVVMDANTSACFAWNHDGLFELVPLAPLVDKLLDAIMATKRWPFE